MSKSLYAQPAASLVALTFQRATATLAEHGRDYQAWNAVRERDARDEIAIAGHLGAHVIRLHAARLIAEDEAPPPWAPEAPPAWACRAAELGEVINARHNSDERILAAMEIRRALSREPAGRPSATIATTLATWLFPSGSSQARAAAGKLAQHIVHVGDHRYWDLLGPAWYAVYGAALVGVLAAQVPASGPEGGRPSNEYALARELLRAAVQGAHAAQIMTKTQLAQEAGVTRGTLDSWLSR